MKIENMHKSIVLLLSFFALSSCAKSVSGMKEGATHCESFGFKRGTEAYARCILIEEIRYVDRKSQESIASLSQKTDLLSK